MLDRLLIAVGLILLGLLVYRLLQQFQLSRRNTRSLDLPGFRAGQATILYFTTPTCAPCRTIQRPALEKIKERFGSSVRVLEIDASQQTTLADNWGVLSVPTTFIIDRQGRPRGVNHGVARDKKLAAQLGQIGVLPAADRSGRGAKLAPSREG